SIEAPVLKQNLDLQGIIGKVVQVQYKNGARRVLLSHLSIRSLKDRSYAPVRPKYIRISVKAKQPDLEPGDVISFVGSLMPPPSPVVPGGFDFRRFAYFKQIGAIGYSMNVPKILRKAPKNAASEYVMHLRHKISERL